MEFVVDELADPLAAFVVLPREGLVEKHRVPVCGHGPYELDASPLPTRELAYRRIWAGLWQGLPQQAAKFLFGAPRRRAKPDVLEGREAFHQPRFLEDHGGALRPAHTTAFGFLEAGERAQQGGLAAPARCHHAGSASGVALKRKRPSCGCAVGQLRVLKTPGTPGRIGSSGVAAGAHPYGKAQAAWPARPKHPDEGALADGRHRDDDEGPCDEVTRLEQELSLVDALSDGAGRHADELGGDSGLPAHPNDRFA